MSVGTRTQAEARPRLNVPTLVLALLAALLLATLAAGPLAAAAVAADKPDSAGESPGEAAQNAGGAGGGWDPLISTLQGIVPIAGALGMLAGIGIWASAGPNRAQRGLGQSVVGCAGCGLAIGLFAPDLAALFTQFI